jgi:hypothetical protein
MKQNKKSEAYYAFWSFTVRGRDGADVMFHRISISVVLD